MEANGVEECAVFESDLHDLAVVVRLLREQSSEVTVVSRTTPALLAWRAW
jgi:hypothetical protein